MNVVREGFADPLVASKRIQTTHSLIDPQVAANIHNTLVRLHESKRKVFISIWHVVVTLTFVAIIGIMMYVSRTWKLYQESVAAERASVNVAAEHLPNKSPPFQEFGKTIHNSYHEPSRSNRGQQYQSWNRIQDWST